MQPLPAPQALSACMPSPKKHLEFEFDDVFGGRPSSSPPVVSRFNNEGLKLSAAEQGTVLK
jgi:hypothetical protein